VGSKHSWADWAVWQPVIWQVGRLVLRPGVEVSQMRSIVGPLIPTFKTKVLSELLNPQTSRQPSSFVNSLPINLGY